MLGSIGFSRCFWYTSQAERDTADRAGDRDRDQEYLLS